MLIEEVQRWLINKGKDAPDDQDRYKAHAEKLDEVADAIFRKSLEVKGGADLNVYLAYADHLRFRDHRDRCLVVARQGLKSPASAKQAATETAMGLHALAVESCLAVADDKARYEAAAPHIKALLECKFARFQALGHLFQGAIDLEKAGMVVDARPDEVSKVDLAKLRASALDHLKKAATQLPDLAEAQARYGVALILNQEPSMGRQYLQLAQRLGNLEPQYQIWAAWSVVQAGYPEDAEPMVARLIQEVRLGRLPKALEGTLHLLSGEIHQARKSPTDLNKAIEEYGRAFGDGQDATPAVELRLAQIEVMLGRPADALKRIDWLVSKQKAGPAAENLAVLTLQELKRDLDARKRLDAARAKFPESAELAVLDASIRTKAGQADAADRMLAGFLAKVPDSVPVVQMRAQVLAKELDRPAEARKLLADVAERGDNSGPLVQLALLELKAKDFDAATASIAKVRARWKDAATGDLLDAQLALARGNPQAASGFFDAALKKDPSNKVVQFWKAQLDGRADPQGASRDLRDRSPRGTRSRSWTPGSRWRPPRNRPWPASRWKAATSTPPSSATARCSRRGQNAANAREIRWQIVAALAAKKEWPAAKARAQRPAQGPQDDRHPRGAGPGRDLLPAQQGRRGRPGALRPGPQGRPDLPGRRRHPRRDPRQEGEAPRGGHLDRAGPRRLREARQAGPGGPLPDDGRRRVGHPAGRPGVQAGPGGARQGAGAGRPNSDELVKARCRVLTVLKGPKAGSGYLEERAKADPKGPFRRMLLTIYADQGELAAAERVAADLVKESPDDASSAAWQVRMIGGQAREAANRGDRIEARRLDDKAAALIYGCRAQGSRPTRPSPSSTASWNSAGGTPPGPWP